jgi:CheY-like chemotaxis protein
LGGIDDFHSAPSLTGWALQVGDSFLQMQRRALGMKPRKILIVDDERALCDSMLAGLQVQGTYQVDQAFNGQEGVDKYKTFLPDLVIMDINMPVMDGYESSREIKSFDPCAKILVLTGNASDSKAKRTVEEGIALTLLKKPLRLRALLESIRENLRGF